jgi:aminoglycoside phosphotransferase (APT) family kinase protein
MSVRKRVSVVAQTERPPAAAGQSASGFESASWIGRTLEGRYTIESLLGEGGMGAVFLAEHTKLQKKVALKVILPQFAGDGELAERFAREAMASAKLDHPHVASALDYGTLPEGGAYLVMQYVRGRSLRSAMTSGEHGWRFACEVGAQIADALAAAHAHKIVHRDLKPENVILEPREGSHEQVKVLDFGVARVAGDDPAVATGKALTRIGTIIGTPGYMAPEQALGELVDGRADLYALGVLLWEIIAGRALFPEGELTAIVTQQLTSTARRLREIVSDVPLELEELIARMLARSRDERPERAGEVRDALKSLSLDATIERKMLSGEIPLSIRTETPAPTITGAAVGALDTDAGTARKIELPASLLAAGTKLGAAAAPLLGDAASRKVDVGPIRGVPASLLAIGCVAPLVLASFAFVLTLAVAGDETESPPPDVAATDGEAPPVDPPEDEGFSLGIELPGFGPRSPADVAIPDSIAEDVALMVESDRRDQREGAAERIRDAHVEDAPAFIEHVVVIELSNRCPARREAVEALGALGDPRAVPTLERLERARTGCGMFGAQDCHRCLRRDLRTALELLRAGSE